MYLLKPEYNYLNDCKVSEGGIVDHLKNVQKGMRNMSRLTQKDNSGNWSVKGLPWKDTYVGQQEIKEV